MKQFNLKEYLQNPSRKVITRDGRPAEIKCTNYVSTSPTFCVIAEIDVKNVKMSFLFRETDGRFDRTRENDIDLFFASEKHEGWTPVYREPTGKIRFGYAYSTKKEAEEASKYDTRYITITKVEWEE